MAIAARYAGTCAVTGRDYPAGASIEKTKHGWALADQQTRDVLAIRETAPIRLKKGEGYGGVPYTVGEVVRDVWWEGASWPQERRQGLVLVQAAVAVYCNGDGMDRGVGDEYGYLYLAWGREATAEEAAPLLAREAAANERQRQAARVTEIATQIARDGTYPAPRDGALTLVGDSVLDTQDLYGGGQWFIIDANGAGPQNTPAIWFVRNNGRDGDDWASNNVMTGGAGAIGCWIAYDETIAAELRALHAALSRVSHSGAPTRNT